MNLLDPNKIDFSLYSRETEGSECIRPASDYILEMIEDLGKPPKNQGHTLPWPKLTNNFRLRPGEVTLWAGINGHGKSLVTGLVATDLIAARQKVCMASMEMKPEETLLRMVRQFTGANPYAEWAQGKEAIAAMRELYRDFQAQCSDLLWIYDQQGSVDPEIMLGVARFCAKKLGVQHLFIDSLMKCISGSDDYNGQKNFVNELFAIARDYGMHIHLIHHIRKGEREGNVHDKFDIRGAGEITDIVDNVLIVWRNKEEEAKRKDIKYDAVLSCCKQRHGDGWEGKLGLYYDSESQQYSETPGQRINFAERAA